MKKQDLNILPEKIRTGQMTEKEVIDEICSFVAVNYPLYGLHKYDEDFRQEIILRLLERGHYLLHLFNPEFGDFFTFLYCYICTLINTKIKTSITDSMREKLNFEEGIQFLKEQEAKYHRIDFNNFDLPKVPYEQNKIPSEVLHKSLRELSLKKQDKKVIILALKSSYYLTDHQIQKICRICGLKQEYFYNMIQQCKNSIEVKNKKREHALERRNFAYYHHKRYNRIIQELKEDNIPERKNLIKEQYYNKEKKHLNNWNKLNDTLLRGHFFLRPTNKTIANVMGICERQVNYYISCAKKDAENQSADDGGQKAEVKSDFNDGRGEKAAGQNAAGQLASEGIEADCV